MQRRALGSSVADGGGDATNTSVEATASTDEGGGDGQTTGSRHITAASVVRPADRDAEVGRVKVNKILTQCRISPNRTLDGLTQRQHDELLTRVGHIEAMRDAPRLERQRQYQRVPQPGSAQDRCVSDEPLSVAQAAQRAGVSTDTIRRPYRSGALGAYPPGGQQRVVIRAQDLDAWAFAGDNRVARRRRRGCARSAGRIRRRCDHRCAGARVARRLQVHWRRHVYKPHAAALGLSSGVPYDLRGSFVSLLAWEGQTLLEVARQAGHSVAVCDRQHAGIFEDLDPAKRVTAEAASRAAREPGVRGVCALFDAGADG